MNALYSLRTRLIVLYTGLILLGFGALAFWAGTQIEAGAEEDFKQRAESEVAIVARGLRDPLENYAEGEAPQTVIAQILENYAQQTGGELNLIDGRGAVWLSTYDPPTGVNYLTLPEVVTAQQNNISSQTRADSTGRMMIFTAAPILEDGRILTIVQLAVPLDEVESSIQERWGVLGFGTAGMSLIVLLMSILISASVTRPLARLRQASLQIADGDFSAHVPDKGRSEIGEVARTFNNMAGRVQAMLEEQRAFASNASHELRTPIMVIQLRTEALLTDNLDSDKQTRYLEEVQSEVRRMSNLVNDLLLLSRLDAGSVEIGRDQIDLPRFARQIIRELQPHAEAKGIEITFDGDDTLPPVSANLTHLHVVFRNILDNAIKYMDDSGGTIHWAMRLDGDSIENLITDTGRGIAPDELDSVLKRFYRADKAHSRAVQGTGLGLSLVQSVVHVYGGEFSLTSEGLSKGTTVRVNWSIKP